MSSKQSANGSNAPRTMQNQAAKAGETGAWHATRDENIRRRAYEIYLERGEGPDSELGDWLQAERELEEGMLSRAQIA